MVEVLADQAFAGSVTVGETDSRAGRFRTGVEIARGHRRKGYAAEATRLVLTYMFAEQRFNKCEVEVHAFNDASLALYRALGFVEEGRLRQHEFFAAWLPRPRAARDHRRGTLGGTPAAHGAVTAGPAP